MVKKKSLRQITQEMEDNYNLYGEPYRQMIIKNIKNRNFKFKKFKGMI